MQVEIFEGIANTPQDSWNQITARYPFVNWGWSRFGEIARPTRTIYYVIVSHEGQPIGGARLAVLDQEYIPTHSPIVREFAKFYIRQRPLIDVRDGATSQFKGIFLPTDPHQRVETAALIRDAAIEIGRKHQASFATFSFLDDELDRSLWGDYLVQEDMMSKSTRLDLSGFSSYDEYLRHLNQKRRKNLNRNTAAGKEAGIRIEIDREIDAPRAIEMIRMVYDKYGVQGYLPYEPIVYNTDLIPQYVWLKAYIGDTLLGAELILYDETTGDCLPRLFGHDPAVELVYFMMYYAEIRYAIEVGAKALYGDSEAYHVKRRLGFVEENRNNLAMKPIDLSSRLIFAALKPFLY